VDYAAGRAFRRQFGPDAALPTISYSAQPQNRSGRSPGSAGGGAALHRQCISKTINVRVEIAF